MRARVDPVTIAEPGPYVPIAEVAQVLGMTYIELKRLLAAAYPTRGLPFPVVASTMVRRSALRGALLAGLPRGDEVLDAFEARWAAVRGSRAARSPLTLPQRQRIIARDGYRCRYCAKKLTRATLQIDHVQPRRLGGLNTDDNLVSCCRGCNYAKGGQALINVGMTLLPAPAQSAAKKIAILHRNSRTREPR